MVDYRYSFAYQVGIGDINYGGHVANSAVLTIFQNARIGYLAHLGPFTELDLGGCGIILPEAHLFFRAEMFVHERLQVGVRCPAVKRSGFDLDYRIERDGQLTAEGHTPVLCYDYAHRKVCRLPAAFRDKLCRFVGL